MSRLHISAALRHSERTGLRSYQELGFLTDPDVTPPGIRLDPSLQAAETELGGTAPEGLDSHSETKGLFATLESLPNPPTVWLPIPKPSKDYLVALQKWEGIVLKRGKETLFARLADRSAVGPDEEAEILLDEISADDLPLVTPGAVFYWSIGYHVDTSGQKRRVSVIRFRRLPAWSEKELQQAGQDADRLRDLFGWNE